MDLSGLSTEDLTALRGGDLSKVSDAGLMALRPVDPALKREAADIAAKGETIGNTLMIGAGRKFDKFAMGLKEAALTAGEKILPADMGGDAARKAREALAASEAEKDTAYAGLQRERPFATGAGEALPFMAIPASAGVLPAAAAVGGIEAASQGTAKERATRGILGAGATAAGGFLGNRIANIISPVTSKAAAPAHQQALAAGERIGRQPSLSEATGSAFFRRMEDYAARAPGGSGVMQEFAQGNQTAVNRAAARSIGETADEMTPQVFADAAHRMGQVFDGIRNLGGRPIQIGPGVVNAANDILRMQGKMLPTQQDPALVSLAQRAITLGANKGRIDGEAYQLIRSGLSEAAYDANGTNRVLYGRLLEALDNSADASLRAGGQATLADALRTVRPQYGNLKTLEKGATAEAGNVSAAKVASTMRTNNPSAFRRGTTQGPLDDVARVGEGLKPLTAGSPTAERQMVSDPLSTAWHSFFSYPIAKATTSPAVTWYPRGPGNTAAARGAAQIAQPSSRAAIAAAMQPVLSPYLRLPVMAE